MKSTKLTPAQIRILECLINGMSNKEIAGELHISYHTVKSRLEELFEKVNLSNRVQLAVWYVRQKD